MDEVRVLNLPMASLHEAPGNPNHMEAKELEALGAAMKAKGFLQPVLVRPLKEGWYEIVDGHHRKRAAEKLGMTEIPCVVKAMNDADALMVRVGMNKIRGELDLGEVGRIFEQLHETVGLTLEEIAITGYSTGEVFDLLSAVSQDVSKGLPAELEVPSTSDYDPDDKDDAAVKLFELKLPFATREELKLVRRKLKQAGGKTKDMSLGLLKLLGEETV
jgi:ParB/RepB/Spo0J family partition protein